MREKLPFIRSRIHAREKQALGIKIILIINKQAIEIEAEARASKRQEINNPQQLNPNPINLRIDHLTNLRTTKIKKRPFQPSYNFGGKLVDESRRVPKDL